jgi:hypothetical protein
VVVSWLSDRPRELLTHVLLWVLQAEQVAREPATPDVRLMRDFADMRPVDIARAYGYLRIAALLDPGRPVELLAYITAGGGTRGLVGRLEEIL